MVETLNELACGYCKKTFRRAESLVVHLCESNRRRLDRSERGVELGFQSYLRFYEIAQAGKKVKTYDEFCESPYYKAFAKFGQYCVSIRAINAVRFTEWLLKNNKKLDYWCSDKLYTEYLTEYLRIEAVSDALTRAIEYSITWSEDTSCQANHILRYGNVNKICHAITTGKISPWVLYNCDSGQNFLSNLQGDQVGMIYTYIDAEFWHRKFKDYPTDTAYAREILQKAGW
jgi:hypothetical protein